MREALTDSSAISWVFFAGNAKPTSMRRWIAERFAETRPVVVVDHPVSVLNHRKIVPFRERYTLLNHSTQSWYYRPLHYPERPHVLGEIGKCINRRLLQSELDRLLPMNGYRIVCYDSPSQYPLVGKLGEAMSVYVAIDDRTMSVTGVQMTAELEAEKKLLDRVDKVVCVSERLAETLKGRLTKENDPSITVISNGYDERLFVLERSWQEPECLRNVPHPRILVTGHISERIDWDGIREASRMRPEWVWVFVGPPDPGIQDRILHDLGPKGFWHPPVSLEEVPGWIQHCDVCAVPYRLNCFTLASSPLKAMEYLAMGSSVLSTRIPALHPYGDVIRWVDESRGESYALGLDKALSEKTDSGRRKARRTAVRNDSWAKKAEAFKTLVLNAWSS